MKKKVFVAIVAAYSMISFIIGAAVIIVLSYVFILSCDNFRPSGDWRITSQELLDEHFPKYVDYALSVIDEYDFEYEYTITNELTDSYSRHLRLEVQFADGYMLAFKFYCVAFEYGGVTHYLEKYTDTFEEATQTPFEYFEIIHKVNEFSIFDLGGDVNTFQKLLDEQIAEGDVMSGYGSSYYYWDGGSSGKKGYELWVYHSNEDGKWCTYYWFEGFLKDDNIWEEKAS